ncbi:unnamed protein product [Mytilus edulis]|uniref:HTH CENPB-type domain-containing protein n=1 Tax=Mytilus edulis TaxID=6550 RepID=A0A8S3QTB6_MYTED|nr:unnamed protein product [Mytilus edulis]
MPKKRKTPKKRKSYTTESLQKAVNDVKHNNMSLRKSSMKYGVPVMTIHDHIAGKVDDGAKPGRPTVLSFEVERKIVEKIKNAAKQGFGITRRLLKVKIARLIRSNKISTPFKNGIPGKDWLSGFLSRHQDLSLRSPLALQTVRSKMLNPVKVNAYFRDLESFLVNLGIQDMPSRIWNMDETSVPLTHKPERVLAETGSKNIPGRVGDCRESLSVLGCINAAGQNIPPMVIVRGKTSKSLNAFNVSEGVPETKYTYQERAWMEDVLSETWFRDHFLRFCGPERPQIILLDSHSSHETLDLIEVARENGIELFTFPPHTTHWLCPLDKTVFGPLIRHYHGICSEFMTLSPNNSVTKWNWPALFRRAYDKAFTPTNITSGFRKCGIYPINKDMIPKEAFAPSQPFDNLSFTSTVKSTTSTSSEANAAITYTSSNENLQQNSSKDLNEVQDLDSDQNKETGTSYDHHIEQSMSERTVSLTPISVTLSNSSDNEVPPVLPTTRVSPHSGFSSQVRPTHPVTSSAMVLSSIIQGSSTMSEPMSDVTIDTITISDNGKHNQTSDDAQILTSEELILSVLRGEIPAVTDDNGFLTVEIENITVDNPTLSSSIEDIFSLPAPQVSSNKSGSKRKITSHRILTSDEILESKRREQNKTTK